MKRFLTALAVAPLALTLFTSGAQAEVRAPARRPCSTSPTSKRGPPPPSCGSRQPVARPPSMERPARRPSRAASPRSRPWARGSSSAARHRRSQPPTDHPFVGADGTPGRSSWRTGYGLATSPDGEAVAFTTRRGGVKVIDQDGDRVLRMPSVPSRQFAQPAHVTNGYCQRGRDQQRLRRPRELQGRSREGWAASSHGIVERPRERHRHRPRTLDRRQHQVLRHRHVQRDDQQPQALAHLRQHVQRHLPRQAARARHPRRTPTGSARRVLMSSTSARASSRTRGTAPARPPTTYFDEVWEDPTHIPWSSPTRAGSSRDRAASSRRFDGVCRRAGGRQRTAT